MISEQNKEHFKKRIEVDTPKGKRYLTYCHVQALTTEDGQNKVVGVDCDKQCPYGKICEHFPDPRHIGDERYAFCDFCADSGKDLEKEGTDNTENLDELKYYIPEEGTIENNLGDVFPSITDIILEKNPLCRVDTVIDSVCDGVCSMYNKAHSECKFENSMCLLRNLFTGPKKATEDNLVDNAYKTDRESNIEPSPFIEIEKN